MKTKFTDSNYLELIKNTKELIVIDFWAEWCGPCKMIAPSIEELANEYEGKALIGKCDVDENNSMAVNYGIRNIPTLLFIKNGEVIDRLVGALPKAKIAETINRYL
ncbi:MAG: thioredoxin [Bacteroidales bacterium]|jgi:thioredoxin 1|nr:thioredoxin [Bacteroidales bacterium]